MSYAGNNYYGVTPLVDAGSGYSLILLQALGAGRYSLLSLTRG
ncbi:hypothetical protein [Mucilaginibacter ginsenosidivorax]|nr:hypothetical protein [Mucilaginibacter ginsenosidivorax]